MSAELVSAAIIPPPRSGQVQRIAADDSASATALDSDFPGKWVSVRVIDGSVYILFGPSTVTVDATATSGATLGYYMTAGDERYFKLSDIDTHIAKDCPTGTANVQICQAGR